MAKAQIIILLAWVLTGFGSMDLPDLNLIADQPQIISQREAVLNSAIAEIGTKEEGGNNRGERIGQYLATTGLAQGHPWCAAFIKFIYNENKIPTPGANAWSPSWFPTHRTYWKRGDSPEVVQKADIFGLYYNNLKRIGHVGVIEKVNDGWIYTIEGNTGSDQGRDGDIVRRHRRSLKTISKISKWVNE